MKLKIAIGVLISAVFIILTFRQVDFKQMLLALKTAKYLWLVPAGLLMAISHWLRAMRWGYLIEPLKPIKTHALFSALMIGYAGNNVFPLRLGEFLRAFAIGKSQDISKSSSFATIVVERFILDLPAMLLLLVITIQFYPKRLPYEEEVKLGGYFLLLMTISLIVLFVFLIKKTNTTLAFLKSIFPEKVYAKIEPTFHSFIEGCMVFKKSERLLSILILTTLIWLLYIFSVYSLFYVFEFTELYNLNPWSSVVILVLVTFSIMIPSAPGALGTYHFLCKKALIHLDVPANEAVSYAIVSHALNILPFTILGLAYFWKQNLHFSDAVAEKERVEHDAEPGTVSPS